MDLDDEEEENPEMDENIDEID